MRFYGGNHLHKIEQAKVDSNRKQLSDPENRSSSTCTVMQVLTIEPSVLHQVNQ